MKNINIEHLGQIQKADIHFGDLTLFTGPNSSGKGITLQLIKLLIDKDHIRRVKEQYGFVWGNTIDSVFDRYFGEGMSGIINGDTKFSLDGINYPITNLLKPANQDKENLFYIPSQRAVCLQNGWPRFFTDYEDSVPYVLRHFSESLRQFLENNENPNSDVIFPQQERLDQTLQNSYNDNIFHDGTITLDRTEKKRFKLNIGKSSIPYMAWSVGQKEFMPLLLSFYWLCPPSDSKRKEGVKYVIIEEPEMGLHPQAIESVILQILDLLTRDYKIIISTHSPVLLELAWVFKYLKNASSDGSGLTELLGSKEADKGKFKKILENKTINTYYFDRINNKVDIKNISTLDAGNKDISISEWGGLSSFSSKAADIISKIVAQQ